MNQWHDKRDSLEQLKSDVKDIRANPDSVRESANRELKKRGYSKEEITRFRLED